MVPTSTRIGSRDARWDVRAGCLLALVLTLAMTVSSLAQTDAVNELITPMFVGGIERMPKPQKHLGSQYPASMVMIPVIATAPLAGVGIICTPSPRFQGRRAPGPALPGYPARSYP